MSIYAIADLHLPFGIDKPMDIFGSVWDNYTNRIKDNWSDLVSEEDYVIIPGDFSWATYLNQSLKDFKYLDSLPGRKILIKGNHDYWWTTITKLNNFIEENNLENIVFINNNCVIYKDIAICGTRGWILTDNEEDEKIYNRELNRLKMSLEYAKKSTPNTIIVGLHYPPLNIEQQTSSFTRLMREYDVNKCVFGHLHGKESHKTAFEGVKDGIEFKLVSCDYLSFNPIKII